MDNQNLTPPPYREDVVSQAPEVIVETAPNFSPRCSIGWLGL